MAETEDLTITRRDLATMRTTPAQIAEAIKLYEATKREEAATASAQERLVMGAFGSWIRRRWKMVAGWLTLIAAGTTGAWEAYLAIEAKAEQAVLERQADEKQTAAVERSAAAIDDLGLQQTDLSLRVEGVEQKIEAQSAINEILLELQLRDPRAKRLLSTDDALKRKIEKTGVRIDH